MVSLLKKTNKINANTQRERLTRKTLISLLKVSKKFENVLFVFLQQKSYQSFIDPT